MDDGYVVPGLVPGSAQGVRRILLTGQGNGSHLSALEEVPCLILLGDVGLGKSTVLAAEAERFKAQYEQPGVHAVRMVDLKGKSEMLAQRALFESAAFKDWAAGNHELTLFVDSLDECWRHVAQLTELIASGFDLDSSVERKRLRLRLACRSGDWHPELEKRLSEVFPGSVLMPGAVVQVFTLLPLSRDDVRQAARSYQIDTKAFLTEVEDRNLQPLVIQPMTLFMLLETYRDGGGLPLSRVELYRKSCLRLCEDPHVTGGQPGVLPRTNASQRREIAGRIAASSIFGNAYRLNSNLDTAEEEPGVLDVGGLTGELLMPQEPTLAVDRYALSETLRAALFSEANTGMQTWRHLSFPEFLAAYHLQRKGIPAELAVSLLTTEDRGVQRVPPALEETAAWLAEMNPAICAELVAANPGAMLRCSASFLVASTRAAIVDALFAEMRAREVSTTIINERWAKLDHPGLSLQLRKILPNRQEPPRVREAALELAAATCADACLDEGVGILIDGSESFATRKAATELLAKAKRAEVATALRAKISVAEAEKWPTDLKAFYASALWPEHLSFAQVVPLLEARRESIYDTNEAFISGFMAHLPPSELLAALAWWSDRDHRAIVEPHYLIPMVAMAGKRLDEPDVVQALAAFLLSADSGDDFLEEIDASAWPAQNRRSLLVALAAKPEDATAVHSELALEEHKICCSSDIDWFAEQWASDTTSRAFWELLIQDVFDRSLEAHFTTIARLPGDNWRTFEQRNSRRSLPAPPLQPAKQVTKVSMPTLDELEPLLAAAEKAPGGVGAINLYRFLVRWPERKAVWPRGDMSTLEIWSKIAVKERERILNVGIAFFTHWQPGDANFNDTNSINFGEQSGVHFILLAALLRPAALSQIATNVWSRWFPHFLVNERFGSVTTLPAWDRVLSMAYSADAPQSLQVVKAFVRANEARGNFPPVLFRLPMIAVKDLEDICFEFVERARITPSCITRIDELLRSRQSVRWADWITATQDEKEEGTSIFALIATVLAFEATPIKVGPAVIGRVVLEPEWGEGFTRHLAQTNRRAKWLTEIPPDLLIRYWDWVRANFPADPYHTGDGTITVMHRIADLRRLLLHELRSRNSADAVTALGAHIDAKPATEDWMGDIHVELKRNSRQSAWNPIPVKGLLRTLDHPTYPPVRSGADLLACVLIALDALEKSFREDEPLIEFWNKTTFSGNPLWSPREETDISTLLKLFLGRELVQFKPVITREPEAHLAMGSASSNNLDLLVTVPVEGAKNAEVIIEVKGTWNDELLTSLRSQLVERYLTHHTAGHGLYLAVHFGGPGWNQLGDSRKKGLASKKVEVVKAALEKERVKLPDIGKVVAVRVIDAGIP